MKNAYLAVSAVVGAAALAAPAHAVLTVETTNFITSPTNSNGFEGLGALTGADGVTSYSEDGITVDYVGTIAGGGIWTQGYIPAPEGDYSWYPDGGGNGYTRITFDDTSEIQFLAGSGFFAPPIDLAYEVLLDGTVIGTGIAGPLPAYTGEGSAFVYYGFSGALFDEIRIQATQTGTGFDPAAFDALAIDAITLGGDATPVVPEPASWAMMIAGFGLIGGAMRRRAAGAAFAA